MNVLRRVFRRWPWIIAGVFGLALAAYAAGLRVNTTASYPVGLYWQTSRSWRKGDLVFLTVDDTRMPFVIARARGYLHEGPTGGLQPLLKRVVAISGDYVDVTDVVRVNGVVQPNSVVQQYDRAGRILPHEARSGAVPTGYVWVMSEYSPESFDSRYFGAVQASAIVGKAVPIVTWTPSH